MRRTVRVRMQKRGFSDSLRFDCNFKSREYRSSRSCFCVRTALCRLALCAGSSTLVYLCT